MASKKLGRGLATIVPLAPAGDDGKLRVQDTLFERADRESVLTLSGRSVEDFFRVAQAAEARLGTAPAVAPRAALDEAPEGAPPQPDADPVAAACVAATPVLPEFPAPVADEAGAVCEPPAPAFETSRLDDVPIVLDDPVLPRAVTERVEEPPAPEPAASRAPEIAALDPVPLAVDEHPAPVRAPAPAPEDPPAFLDDVVFLDEAVPGIVLPEVELE